MGIHSSLKVDPAGAQQRTVLTRIERIKELMKKGLWSDEHKVIGLPKTKIVRIKAAKKAKAEEAAAPGEAGKADVAAKPEAAAAKPGAKAEASKPAAGKDKK